MQITIKFSSFLKTYSGVDQERIVITENTTLEQLPEVLKNRWSKLPLENSQNFFVVNNKIQQKDYILAEGDVINIYQALAGG